MSELRFTPPPARVYRMGIAPGSLFFCLALAVLTAAATDAPEATAQPDEAIQEKTFGGVPLSQWQSRLVDFDADSPRAAKAVPALTAILLDADLDDVTRRNAALALGRIGREAQPAVPALVELIEASRQGRAKPAVWAAKAISLMGPYGRDATGALVAALRDTRRDMMLRQMTVEALALIGGADPDAIGALVELVRAEPPAEGTSPREARLRQLAVEALGVAGADAAVAAPLLVRIIRSPRESEAIRRRSVAALGAIGPATRIAVEPLVETLVSDPSEAVRDEAGNALGAMGQPAVPVLRQLLRHSDQGVRWRAAKALGDVGETAQPAVTDLRKALADPHEQVRLQAADALWRIERRGRPLLLTVLHLMTSDDRNTRMRSLELLVAMDPRAAEVQPQLEQLASDPRRHVRQIAEQALRKIQQPQP